MTENENRQYSRFERGEEYLGYLSTFLSLDLSVEPDEAQNDAEDALLLKLTLILYEYQEQSNLMDPYLERMVLPAVNAFRAHARLLQQQSAITPVSALSRRLMRLTELTYRYTQVRGRKTIGMPVRFFPHQVDDLSTALACLSPSINPASQSAVGWAYRYLVLLWLSLICKIPFDLARFDDDETEEVTPKGVSAQRTEHTASKLEDLGKQYLSYAGMEGVGAALLLAGLYNRQDTASMFPGFITSAKASIAADADSFTTIGVLRVLNHIIKMNGSAFVAEHEDSLEALLSGVKERKELIGNSLVKQLMAKLICRRALTALPPPVLRARVKVKVLASTTSHLAGHLALPTQNAGYDVPSFVEDSLEDIFSYLQDRDTIVRWSASKGLARISERLPPDFNDQVVDTVLDLFSIHSLAAENDLSRGKGRMDVQLPASAESTWHGACLATAEFARRDLISNEKLPKLMHWMSQALYFDVRKGAHSVGSSVRDAASYVLWALARSQDAATMQPFALEIARRLVAVSVYDREIHIRRAASAAFQENVGRLSVFPHGIDVLRKTDFYAVSVRRHSFLTAAVQVAEHSEYRPFLIDHLLTISIRHWDPAMRVLAAQGVRGLCDLDLGVLGAEVIQRVAPLLESSDGNEVHGALVTLAELADAFVGVNPPLKELHIETFKCLGKLPPRIIKKYGNEQILCGISLLTQNSLSDAALGIPNSSTWWEPALEVSLKHRDINVQESAAGAMAALSRLRPCADYVKGAARDFARANDSAQQGFAKTLGVLSYASFEHGVDLATRVLVDAITSTSSGYSKNVEARRNACYALSEIVASTPNKICPSLGGDRIQKILSALLHCLDDYTVDQRGDVGSWIRIAAIHGIGCISKALFQDSNIFSSGRLESYLPPPLFVQLFSALLKQGSERLDTVRHEAGAQIVSLIGAITALDTISRTEALPWRVPGFDAVSSALMLPISQNGIDLKEFWSDGSLLYLRIIPLLAIEAYRRSVLTGVILSIGSKNEATRRPASESLKTFVHSLPLDSTGSDSLSVASLCELLFALAKENYQQNQLFIPILATLDIVIDDKIATELATQRSGLEILKRVVNVASRNVDKAKSVPRILASMKIVVGMLSITPLRALVAGTLRSFLDHRFPTVRVAAAEEIYVKLQTSDVLSEEDDEVEDLLLETPWATNGEYESARDSVLRALRNSA